MLTGELWGRFPSCCSLCFAGRVLLQKREPLKLSFFWVDLVTAICSWRAPVLPSPAGADWEGALLHVCHCLWWVLLLCPERTSAFWSNACVCLACVYRPLFIVFHDDDEEEGTSRWAGWKKGLSCPSSGGIWTAQPRSCLTISWGSLKYSERRWHPKGCWQKVLGQHKSSREEQKNFSYVWCRLAVLGSKNTESQSWLA